VIFTEYIVFAHYPPRPDISHGGGLVGLCLSHISHVNLPFLWLNVISIYIEGDNT
jgi:hypothetical protein